MYHELELAGRPLCQSDPGYARYILPLATFRRQIEWLKQSDFRGVNVSEALAIPAQPAVCITFDDGCETDLIAASPVLREFGFAATFYVTAGFLGQSRLSEFDSGPRTRRARTRDRLPFDDARVSFRPRRVRSET